MTSYLLRRLGLAAFTLLLVTFLIYGLLRAMPGSPVTVDQSNIDPSKQLSPEAIDAYVFHQANEFMLKHLAKNMQLPPEKVPLILRDFGNTSSASIPLTIMQKLREPLQSGSQTLLLGGFGVGLSWGAVTMQAGPMVIPDLIEADESVIPAPLFSRN